MADGHDLIVNTTPYGMGERDDMPAPFDKLDPNIVAAGVTTKPEIPPLLADDHRARSGDVLSITGALPMAACCRSCASMMSKRSAEHAAKAVSVSPGFDKIRFIAPVHR